MVKYDNVRGTVQKVLSKLADKGCYFYYLKLEACFSDKFLTQFACLIVEYAALWTVHKDRTNDVFNGTVNL